MQDKKGYIKGNNSALCVSCNNEEDIRTLFEGLSENGKIQKPLKEEFWGGIFGSVEDQFGIIPFLIYDKK